MFGVIECTGKASPGDAPCLHPIGPAPVLIWVFMRLGAGAIDADRRLPRARGAALVPGGTVVAAVAAAPLFGPWARALPPTAAG